MFAFRYTSVLLEPYQQLIRLGSAAEGHYLFDWPIWST
jgi:hypothetical protein